MILLGVDVVRVRGERPPRHALIPLLLAGHHLALVVFRRRRRNLLQETKRYGFRKEDRKSMEDRPRVLENLLHRSCACVPRWEMLLPRPWARSGRPWHPQGRRRGGGRRARPRAPVSLPSPWRRGDAYFLFWNGLNRAVFLPE